MIACPSCGGDRIGARTEPRGGTVRFCRDCDAVLPAEPAQLAAPPSVQADEQSELATKRTRPAPKKEPADVAPANPVPAMKARLRWLDGEIKRLRKLEAEREQLSRILSAASGKPVAVVRELKRSHA